MRVHERGEPRVDGILRLLDEAARPRPLSEVLAALCAEISSIHGADVVSLYLRDRDAEGDALRMAANVGFPAGAVSKVRLRVGEGITGFVAETLRPVSVRLAPEHERFRAFPELGEERFPIFLAVPLIVGRRAEGVMVLQRAERAFSEDEIALATALAISFAYALERARVRRSEILPGHESRRARLEGIALAPGSALGRVETLPTFEGLAATVRAKEGDAADSIDAASIARRRGVLMEALDNLVRDLERVRRKLSPELPDSSRAQLEVLALAFSDGRLAESISEDACRANVALGLRKLAREYAQAPLRAVARDPYLTERSDELEELLLLVAARAIGERVPTGGAALLVSERLSAVVALAAAAHKTSAIAVGNRVRPDALGPQIARAAGIPVVGDVGGLFAWSRAGDVVLVDGTDGVVRVNPSATQIARFRRRDHA